MVITDPPPSVLLNINSLFNLLKEHPRGGNQLGALLDLPTRPTSNSTTFMPILLRVPKPPLNAQTCGWPHAQQTPFDTPAPSLLRTPRRPPRSNAPASEEGAVGWLRRVQ